MTYWISIALLLALPAAHPLLIPWVGVPSHLLWWVHVLPVALIAFRHGKAGAVGTTFVSVLAVIAGERLFGAGYGVPAPWETAWALSAAVLGTHVLVAGFALYARAKARSYQLLFDHAVSAILRTDSEGRIVAANPAALRLFGCEWSDLANRTFGEVPWLRALPAPGELVGGGWSGTVDVGPEDRGKISHVSAVAFGGGDPGGHQVILLDRSEEVARDRESERQGRLAVLGSTLAGVAHEMKNPLQIIMGHAELSLDPAATGAEAKESLGIVQEQAERLRDLVQDLLGFSRSREGPGEIVLANTVRRIAELQRVSHGRAVLIRERIAWTGWVKASPVRVEQIVANLVANAVDASPAGRGVVELEVEAEGGDAIIRVSDDGPGIEPELLDRIFDPFVTTKAEGEGTGLGLAISRRLASAMGGTLTARNREGSGAVFELRIPIHNTVSAAPERRAAAGAS
ncbi:MAG: PAS domain-containing sensor histidine kinase [Gemmatimonadota bacterium]